MFSILSSQIIDNWLKISEISAKSVKYNTQLKLLKQSSDDKKMWLYVFIISQANWIKISLISEFS